MKISFLFYLISLFSKGICSFLGQAYISFFILTSLEASSSPISLEYQARIDRGSSFIAVARFDLLLSEPSSKEVHFQVALEEITAREGENFCFFQQEVHLAHGLL